MLATCDEPGCSTQLRDLNASLELGNGVDGLHLFKTVKSVGDAFACVDEFNSIVTAAKTLLSNQSIGDPIQSEFDVQTANGADVDRRNGSVSPPSVVDVGGAQDGAKCEEGSDVSYGSDADTFSCDGDSDRGDDAMEVYGAEGTRLTSSEITKLYHNKRKCEEREERRVASRMAKLDTNDGGVIGNNANDTSEKNTETWEMKRCARDQIFSISGAFQRLYSELFSLQKNQSIGEGSTATSCLVQAVEHDVYEWDVRFPFSAFDEGDGNSSRDSSRDCLRSDLETLEAVNGYDYVQVRASFKPDLYPFYPPRVKVVRPKLKGSVPFALTAHPKFHLKNWQPFTGTADVLLFTRDFLKKNARVDLECSLNDPEQFPAPHGAYADHLSLLETTLANLAACGTSRGNPITPDAYAELYEQQSGSEKGKEKESSEALQEALPSTFADSIGDGTATHEKDSEAERLNSERKDAADAKKEAWAKGTGYGFDSSKASGGSNQNDGGGSPVAKQNWDANAARLAQSAEDAVVRNLIEETTSLIRIGVSAWDCGEESDDKKNSDASDSTSDSFKSHFSKLGKTFANISKLSTEQLIRNSCIADFISRELTGCAFMDMTVRAEYYVCLLSAVFALCESGSADLLGDEISGKSGKGKQSKQSVRNASSNSSHRSVEASLREVSQQAEIYLRSMKAATGGTKDGVRASTSKHSDDAATKTSKTQAKNNTSDDDALASLTGGTEGWRKNAIAEISLARQILAAHNLVSSSCVSKQSGKEPTGPRRSTRDKNESVKKSEDTPPAAKTKGKGRCGGKNGGTSSSTATRDSDEFTSEKSYVEAMRAFVFDVDEHVSGEGDGTNTNPSDCLGAGPAGASSDSVLSGRKHAFLDEAARDLKLGPHLVRVAREMAGLSATLPLSRSSSALVRVDERKVVLWSVAITGPEDTPYDSGFFLFDSYFPSGYPTSAPKLKFKTTGGGRARLNPNLYKDGKVCLSLLGTWQGARGETWDASCSTITQVIISIQSLIFVNEPFFNEPGYERSMGTPDGTRQSDAYNRQIVEYTVRYAMLEQLRKPNLVFRDAIFEHFKRRRTYILGPLKDRFLKEAGDPKSEPRKLLEGLFKELQGELEKL